LQKVELDEVVLLARHRVVECRRLVLLADAGRFGGGSGRTRGLVDKAALVPALAVDGVAVPRLVKVLRAGTRSGPVSEPQHPSRDKARQRPTALQLTFCRGSCGRIVSLTERSARRLQIREILSRVRRRGRRWAWVPDGLPSVTQPSWWPPEPGGRGASRAPRAGRRGPGRMGGAHWETLTRFTSSGSCRITRVAIAILRAAIAARWWLRAAAAAGLSSGWWLRAAAAAGLSSGWLRDSFFSTYQALSMKVGCVIVFFRRI
jgi:hypothetical protein